jgi:hypothetical protein
MTEQAEVSIGKVTMTCHVVPTSNHLVWVPCSQMPGPLATIRMTHEAIVDPRSALSEHANLYGFRYARELTLSLEKTANPSSLGTPRFCGAVRKPYASPAMCSPCSRRANPNPTQ